MNLSLSATTSPSFVQGVLIHDAESWRRLSALYGPLVYRWARQSGLQPNDAEDVVQEVFRGVAGGIARFHSRHGKGSFRRWLWGITRNKTRDHYDRLAKSPQAQGGTDAQRTVGSLAADSVRDVPSEALSANDNFDVDASLVHRAMSLLQSDFEPNTWRAFWRMAVDGQPSVEVAEELQMTKKAVRQAKYRVLKRLRAELDQ